MADEELQDAGIQPEEAAEPTDSAPVEETEEEQEPGDDSTAEPPKQSKGVQKRIDELVRQREEERRRSERLEQMLHEMYSKGQQPPKQEQQAPPEEKAPSIDDFANYDDYLRAAARYEARQEYRQEMTRSQKEAEQRRQREAQESQQRAMAESANRLMEQGRAKYADFEELIASSQAPSTPVMQQAIIESDMGHDVAYHLVKNPKEAERIAGLSPYAQVREIGRLEAKLSAPVKKTSNAPPPPNPVGGKGSGVMDSERLLREDPAKWIKLRNEGKI